MSTYAVTDYEVAFIGAVEKRACTVYLRVSAKVGDIRCQGFRAKLATHKSQSSAQKWIDALPDGILEQILTIYVLAALNLCSTDEITELLGRGK
jgi:hypothetical protein